MFETIKIDENTPSFRYSILATIKSSCTGNLQSQLENWGHCRGTSNPSPSQNVKVFFLLLYSETFLEKDLIQIKAYPLETWFHHLAVKLREQSVSFVLILMIIEIVNIPSNLRYKRAFIQHRWKLWKN